MKRLSALLLSVMSGAALAQTTGTVNPSPTPAEPSVKHDVPPGGCMPIGLTASGEIVFPMQCKEFIERRRGRAVEQTSKRSPQQNNRKAWGQRTANRQLNRLKQFHYQSGALTMCRAGAARAWMTTAPRTIGPTIQHRGPTSAMMDYAVPADKFKSKRPPTPTRRWCDGGGLTIGGE
jgi:hypothetical protein